MIRFEKIRHKSTTILKCIQLYLSYPLSYREVEKIMLGEGINVDNSTINIWAIKHTPKNFKKVSKNKKKFWVFLENGRR